MFNFLKKRYKPEPALDVIWKLTPSPHTNTLVELQEAMYRQEKKVQIASNSLRERLSCNESKIKKNISTWLQLDATWSKIILADTMRWAITQGADLDLLRSIASSNRTIPGSHSKRKEQCIQLCGLIIDAKSAIQAFNYAVELCVLIDPSADLTVSETLDKATYLNVFSNFRTSAKFIVGVSAFMAAFAYGLRWGVVWLVMTGFTSFGAQFAAGIVSNHVGKLITGGVATQCVRIIATAKILWKLDRRVSRIIRQSN